MYLQFGTASHGCTELLTLSVYGYLRRRPSHDLAQTDVDTESIVWPVYAEYIP